MECRILKWSWLHSKCQNLTPPAVSRKKASPRSTSRASRLPEPVKTVRPKSRRRSSGGPDTTLGDDDVAETTDLRRPGSPPPGQTDGCCGVDAVTAEGWTREAGPGFFKPHEVCGGDASPILTAWDRHVAVLARVPLVSKQTQRHMWLGQTVPTGFAPSVDLIS